MSRNLYIFVSCCQPFQHCDAEDSECEEGASSDVLNHAEEIQFAQEVPSVVFVTPVVVSPVDVEKTSSELPITITAEQPDNTPKEQ